MPSRRALLASLQPLALMPTSANNSIGQRDLTVETMEVFVVSVTSRSNWIFVRLGTNKGLTGIGEASLGHLAQMPLAPFFALVEGTAPMAINDYRRRAWPLVRAGGVREATAASAIEQALWDLAGKALDAPVHALLGGAVRERLPVYANINRATFDRTPGGFAARTQAARAEGFSAFKAAPFDGFPSPESPSREIEAATDLGIRVMLAMREVLPTGERLMVDCHSFFDVPRALSVARALQPAELYWYEEPVDPTDLDATVAIKQAITQPMAGGEMLFATEGFAPLCEAQAYDVIMPDVKHCGGILEAANISHYAQQHDIAVAPHNPSGPLATVASAHVCAVAENFDMLEMQWNEAPWSGDLLVPPEQFVAGHLEVPSAPGLGVELNDALVVEHQL